MRWRFRRYKHKSKRPPKFEWPALYADGTPGFVMDFPTLDQQLAAPVLFTDDAGTVPVTAVGDVIGSVTDASGNAVSITQSTTPAKMRYGRWPQSAVIAGGVLCKVANTDNIEGSTWSALNTVAIDENQFTESSDSAVHQQVNQAIGIVSGNEYTSVVSLAKGVLPNAPDYMQISFGSAGFGGNQYAVVNVSDGTVYTTGPGATCVSLGEDLENPGAWIFKYTATATSNQATNGVSVLFCNNNPALPRAPSYAGDTDADCFYYWLDVREGTAFETRQRVGASATYDVTEAGQPTRYFAYCDATDDFLDTSSIDFSSTDEMTMMVGTTYKGASGGYTTPFVEISADTTANNGTASFGKSGSGGDGTVFYSSAGTNRAATNEGTANALLQNSSSVFAQRSKISTPFVSLSKNGIQLGEYSLSQGSGNYGNYPVYIGSRGGSSLFFNGNIYCLAVIGKLLTAQEQAQAERYIANKMKGYLG